MYKALADKVKDAKLKGIFLQLAKDEGKHAAIIRKITGEVLMPKKSKASVITFIYQILGLKVILKLISNGEFEAAKSYISIVELFPEVEEIRQDEIKHGETIKKYLSQL
jgi:rubrerythrin